MTRPFRSLVAVFALVGLMVAGIPAAAFAAETDAETFTIELSAEDYEAAFSNLGDKVEMPDLVGLRADVATDLLKGLKLKWKFSKLVIIKKNWWVTKQATKPGAMVAEGKKIKLTVSKKKPNATPTPRPEDQTTTGGLSMIGGWIACEDAGASAYRFGFNLHYFVGVIAETYDPTTDSWFLKANVTITNAFNAKYETVAECTVTGSESAPVVTSLYVYP